jgi:hypothetical protein
MCAFSEYPEHLIIATFFIHYSYSGINKHFNEQQKLQNDKQSLCFTLNLSFLLSFEPTKREKKKEKKNAAPLRVATNFQ